MSLGRGCATSASALSVPSPCDALGRPSSVPSEVEELHQGYSDVHAQVRGVMSCDLEPPIGAIGYADTQLGKNLSNTQRGSHFVEIMGLLGKRPQDKGKTGVTRPTYSPTALDCLFHAGSEDVVRDNVCFNKTLEVSNALRAFPEPMMAPEEDKRTVEEQQARQRMTAEERDLQQAIRLNSTRGKRPRAKTVQDANQSAFFNDAQQTQQTSTKSSSLLVDTPSQGQLRFLWPRFTAVLQRFNLVLQMSRG
ncbi:hypothetical protein C8T65DRAFT_701069 [Cerioporus squamosus]|nr:hypothetical protein C8T65DRAFT_701069 [Cerioporus squamosus]